MNDAAKVQHFCETCKFLYWENSWDNGKKERTFVNVRT